MTKVSHLIERIESIAKLLGLNHVQNPANSHTQFEIDKLHDCLLFKGDNLDVMAGLLRARAGAIDFCYIDPPYNTGQEFIYSDNKFSTANSLWSGRHDWLAFMLPRLVAVHLLLQSEGVIAISIDDYEYANLKVLMDCIFGGDKYIATLIICRSKNGKGSKQNVAVNHEYVLLYGKSANVPLSGLMEDESRLYDKQDEHGQFRIDGMFRKKGDASRQEDRPNMHYPLYYSADGKVYTEKWNDSLSVCTPQDSKGIARRWLWGPEKAKLESWKLYASKNGTVYVKNYKTEGKRIKLRSIWDSPNYLTDKATGEIKALYGEKVFETPKPLSLIRDLIDCCAKPDATVLDFFAGTGTTAEAVWDLNKRDSLSRKTILVEQKFPIVKGHIARTRGFSHTSDLAEFRLKAIQQRDHGFVFDTIELSGALGHSLA